MARVGERDRCSWTLEKARDSSASTVQIERPVSGGQMNMTSNPGQGAAPIFFTPLYSCHQHTLGSSPAARARLVDGFARLAVVVAQSIPDTGVPDVVGSPQATVQPLPTWEARCALPFRHLSCGCVVSPGRYPTVQLLERLGHEVVFPARQTCRGQMHVNTGYQAEATRWCVITSRCSRTPIDAVVDPLDRARLGSPPARDVARRAGDEA